jgi:DNA-binding MarR family transcriptional regulator
MPEAVPIREMGQSKESPALTANEKSELVDAVLTASRVMVAIAARSLGSSGEDVTLPQFRALVLLGAQGPLRPADLAEALSVDPSTVTRLCDRLETKKLISRRRIREDRREVWIHLSSAGQQFLDAVSDNRRTEIARIIALLPPNTHSRLLDAFTLFGVAAGETPERNWTQAWQL